MSDTTPFKLEIRSESNSISFGRRSVGQSGRDIIAVKLALGLIQDLQGILSINPEAYKLSNKKSIFNNSLPFRKIFNSRFNRFHRPKV